MTAISSGTSSPRTKRPARRAWGDALLAWSARGAAACVVVLLGLLLFVLIRAALPAMQTYGAGFLTQTEWRVNALDEPIRDAAGKLTFDEDGEMVTRVLAPVYGAAPTIYGTFVSSLIAIVVAVPLSLGAALFLVRIAPRWRLATAVGFLIEFLAAIPSLAFGVWGVFVLVPFMRDVIGPAAKGTIGQISLFGWQPFDWLFFRTTVIDGVGVRGEIAVNGWNMLTGGLILAIMILPIITSVARDVLRSVPRSQIEASLALGATWWQSSVLMLRYARSGLFGAVMLGLARAAGETMAVTMVIGNANQISASFFEPAQTMASLLATEFGEAGADQRSALLFVALILLVMSLLINIIARYFVVGSAVKGSAGQ
jgi:phosphate transport system permease protein